MVFGNSICQIIILPDRDKVKWTYMLTPLNVLYSVIIWIHPFYTIPIAQVELSRESAYVSNLASNQMPAIGEV